jgi:hypothetical protein
MQEGIFWKSEGHKERFLAAIQQIGKIHGGKIDSEYGAAIYVLTADQATWAKAQDYVSSGGIWFKKMLQEQDWSGGMGVLIQWAANLFNENAAHCDPVELMRLDERNFEVALSALQLRYHLRYDSTYMDDFK